MFLGIEIGGTKLQLGLGHGDGRLAALWRGVVNPGLGSEGIRTQIVGAVPELLAKANLDRGHLKGIGIGFGGPTDDRSNTVIRSHQIDGWGGFPLADWVSDLLGGVPAVLCNDADVAGLAEALFGAGKGLSPIFYLTIGSGIGGGLIIDGQIYRGVGRGAAEIGHFRVLDPLSAGGEDWNDLEELASGFGIVDRVRYELDEWAEKEWPTSLTAIPRDRLTAKDVWTAAARRDQLAERHVSAAFYGLRHALRAVITLLCPRCIVIGGGVSLVGERQFFEPLRRQVADGLFEPFAGLTDIVPAALGEEVVVHGALALARQKFGG